MVQEELQAEGQQRQQNKKEQQQNLLREVSAKLSGEDAGTSPSSPREVVSATSSIRGQPHVLVVEDNPINQKGSRRLLPLLLSCLWSCDSLCSSCWSLLLLFSLRADVSCSLGPVVLRMLHRLSCQTSLAQNGQEAVEFLRGIREQPSDSVGVKGAAGSVNLVLMDLSVRALSCPCPPLECTVFFFLVHARADNEGCPTITPTRARATLSARQCTSC